jgi:hypothetical protein
VEDKSSNSFGREGDRLICFDIGSRKHNAKVVLNKLLVFMIVFDFV